MLKFINIQNTLTAIALMFSATLANAHEVWLERDGDASVRIYLGEPGEPEAGDKIDNIKGAQVFTDNRASLAALSRQENHWQAAVSGAGDVRFFSDKIWQPWQMDDIQWWQFWKTESSLQGAIVEARLGRLDKAAQLIHEIVPVASNGDVFVVLFKGNPLLDQEINVLSPSKKQLQLKTDADGKFILETSEKGHFVLSSVHTIDTEIMLSGKKVSSVMYITSLSFVLP